MKKNTQYLSESALISAFYVVLTTLTTIIAPHLTFGPIQLRVSEALVILPLLTPAAIPGLFVGCIISNAIGLAMGANIAGALDILLGSVATLAAAVLTRWLRNVKFTKKSRFIWDFPFVSLLPPVILNGLIVGLELSLFVPGNTFLLASLSVGISEFVVVYCLGIPLYYAVLKAKVYKDFT